MNGFGLDGEHDLTGERNAGNFMDVRGGLLHSRFWGGIRLWCPINIGEAGACGCPSHALLIVESGLTLSLSRVLM